MRKFATALALALVLVVVAVSAAGATHSIGLGPKMDLVAGTGTLDVSAFPSFPQNPQLHVNAKRDPETGDEQGRFFIRVATLTGQFDARGEIVCLDVVGNLASLVGRIDRTNGTSPYAGFVEGNYVQIEIQDMGEPGTFDRAIFAPGTTNIPDCSVHLGTLPISQGNFIVHDYPPASLLPILDQLIQHFEAAAGYPFGN